MKKLSTLTKIYLLIIYLLGIYFCAYTIPDIHAVDLSLLAILAILGSVLHILRVEGPTNRSHYTLSFIVFGFALALYGGPAILIVIFVAGMFEWIVNPPTAWYIQPFNMGCYIIAAQAASFIYSAVNSSGSLSTPATIIAIFASMVSFTFLNHFIVGIILWLARGENFKQSGVFDITPLVIDLTMLSLGASLAIVWTFNPYALLLFLMLLFPFYKTLKIPALERKSETDQKTGLFNHGHFMSQLKHELQRANRYDRPLSVIMADLDLLRNINNTYGHLAGDDVLKGIALILQETVREYDVVARFGGEEFAILMPEATLEQAFQRAEVIRKAVETHHFAIPTSVDPIKVTMSLGVASREDFEQSGEEIIHNADTALYKSKVNGRNRVSHTQFQADNFVASSNNPEGILVEVEDVEENSYSPPIAKYSAPHPVNSNSSQMLNPTVQQQEHTVNSNHPQTHHVSSRKVYLYIAGVAFFAFLVLILGNGIWFSTPETTHEWVTLAVLILLTILTEGFSINLYVGNTSISTTAVPLVAGFILFGPFGIIVCSAAYAITTALKFRSPLNRLVFNFSNHIIAGMVVHLMVTSSGVFLQNWNVGIQLLYTLASSVIIYFVTTILISIGIGIDLKQHPFEIWKEQYQWMAVYYIGIGFVSYSLIFGYKHADLLGIVFLAVPLLLLRFSQVQYVGHTRDIVKTLRKKNQDLEKSADEIQELSEGLLTTLSEIIDLRDPYVLGHSKQVSVFATKIARELNINTKQVELIRKAGLLHDIGKLGIPMELLTKPSSLTTEEYEVIKKHAALGGDLVKNTPSLRPLAQIIRHHHEHFDGMGYPDKIAGNQIGIEARVVAVSDAIEAMTSDRPYRRALKPEKVRRELIKNSGTQFDPLVVDAAIKMLDKMQETEITESVQRKARSKTASKFVAETQNQ